MDIDDDEVAAGFGGGDFGDGVLFGILVGARSVVEGGTAGGFVVSEEGDGSVLLVNIERDGGFGGGFATTDEGDAFFAVGVDSREGGIVATIDVVVAGELDDVEADVEEGVEEAGVGADVGARGEGGEAGLVGGVGEVEGAQERGERAGEVFRVADFGELGVHAAGEGGDAGLGEGEDGILRGESPVEGGAGEARGDVAVEIRGLEAEDAKESARGEGIEIVIIIDREEFFLEIELGEGDEVGGLELGGGGNVEISLGRVKIRHGDGDGKEAFVGGEGGDVEGVEGGNGEVGGETDVVALKKRGEEGALGVGQRVGIEYLPWDGKEAGEERG